jgi:hypothetical protein
MHERQKKIGPIARLIEGMLDCALIAGLVAAIGFLISLALSFDPERNENGR